MNKVDKIFNWLLFILILFMLGFCTNKTKADELSDNVTVNVWEINYAFTICVERGGLDHIIVRQIGENLAVCGDGSILGMDIPLQEIKRL